MTFSIEELTAHVEPLTKEEEALLMSLFMASEQESVSPAAFFLLQLLIAEATQREEIDHSISQVTQQILEATTQLYKLDEAFVEYDKQSNNPMITQTFGDGCEVAYQVTVLQQQLRELKAQRQAMREASAQWRSQTVKQSELPSSFLWSQSVQQMMMSHVIEPALEKFKSTYQDIEPAAINPLTMIQIISLQMKASAQFQRTKNPRTTVSNTQHFEQVKVENPEDSDNKLSQLWQQVLTPDEVEHLEDVPIEIKTKFLPLPREEAMNYPKVIQDHMVGTATYLAEKENPRGGKDSEELNEEQEKEFYRLIDIAIKNGKKLLGEAIDEYNKKHQKSPVDPWAGIDDKFINEVLFDYMLQVRVKLNNDNLNLKLTYIKNVGLDKNKKKKELWFYSDLITFFAMIEMIHKNAKISSLPWDFLRRYKQIVKERL